MHWIVFVLVGIVWCYELSTKLDSVVIRYEDILTQNVNGCDYNNVSFVYVTFRNIQFKQCNMSDIRFINSTFINLRLYEVSISLMTIKNSRLELVLNENSQMSNVTILSSVLSECITISEESAPIKISNMSITNSNISYIKLVNVVFSNVSVYNTRFVNVDTTDVYSYNLSLYSSSLVPRSRQTNCSSNLSTFISVRDQNRYASSYNRYFSSYDDYYCFYCDLDVKLCPLVNTDTPFLEEDMTRECNMLHPSEIHSATISRCGSRSYKPSIIDKCHRDINKYESFEYLKTPAADLILRKMTVNSVNTSLIYKNIYCAICNNEFGENLEFNPIYNGYKGQMKHDEPPSYIYDITHQMRDPNRFIKLMLLDISLFSTSNHIQFINKVKSCSRFVSTCTDFSNMDDVYRCYWYPAAYRIHMEVEYIFTIYRNKYCAKCNNVKEVSCRYPNVPFTFRFQYILIKINLTLLLNSSSNWLIIEHETYRDDMAIIRYDSIARKLERESSDIFEIRPYLKD